MCGIFGYVATGDKVKDDKVFWDLMDKLFIETQARGEHASGYAALYKSKDGERAINSSKLPISAALFTQHDVFWRILPTKKPSILIGHTRFATHGDPKVNSNNHPFASADKRWWLVHNGIVAGERLSDSVKDMLKTDCDSEMILRAIERNGREKGCEVVANCDRSDFAILFIDKVTGELNFMRNDKRPLWVWDVRDRFGCYVLSSTEEIMLAACKLAGVKMKKVKRWQAAENILYTVKAGEPKISQTKIKVEERKAAPAPAPLFKDFSVDDVFSDWEKPRARGVTIHDVPLSEDAEVVFSD